jgi:Tfp pilus assembly protein PilV
MEGFLMRRRLQSRSGIALIEALIALAIMAFGMLAVVGMQATLRQNSDVSRQRAEAVRIAQQRIEQARAFAVLADPADPNNNSTFSKLNSGTVVVGATVGGNAEFTLSTLVAEGAGIPSLETAAANLKSVQVDVGWTDRNGAAQGVRLSTAIHGVAPELAGSLSVPPNGYPTSSANRRNASIPWDSIPIGIDGKESAFLPPQAQGGSVVWVFNNFTGSIRICSLIDASQPLTKQNVNTANCEIRAQLLRGFVNFAGNSNQVATPEQALSPQGRSFAVQVEVVRTAPATISGNPQPACFTRPPASQNQPNLEYFCAIPVASEPAAVTTPTAVKWSGYSYVTSQLLPVSTAIGDYVTCRYTSLEARSGANPPPVIPNAQHPRAYLDVGGPLVGQNFLVVKALTNTIDDCPNVAPLPNTTVITSTTYPHPQTPP